ncbi:TPA: hypothetical protein EYP44_03045 [Candidatus Bathyarchaeota archaeon]|nr:hypothetical protein [Candidatus Bathyarchaeota archaeon]
MLYLLVGSVTVDGLFFGVMCPCLIIYATDVLRIEEFEWALLLAWLSAVTICSALPSGKLIDGFGRRAVGQLIGGFLYDHVSPQTPFLPRLVSSSPTLS